MLTDSTKELVQAIKDELDATYGFSFDLSREYNSNWLSSEEMMTDPEYFEQMLSFGGRPGTVYRTQITRTFTPEELADEEFAFEAFYGMIRSITNNIGRDLVCYVDDSIMEEDSGTVAIDFYFKLVD